MSAREWKPGDVALVTVDGDELQAIRDGSRGWLVDGGYIKDNYTGLTVRPLVVIDPENAEQIGRLAEAWDAQTHATLSAVAMSLPQYRMQAALRSLIATPKPEEPTGLGAVVEDEEGDIWVRVAGDAYSTWHHGGRFPKRWRDISVVRVLSEGMQP